MKARSRIYGRVLLDREEFLEFANNSDELRRLHAEWVAAGYKMALTPSIDRIDNDGGYTTGNMQFLTLGDNVRKGRADGAYRAADADKRHKRRTILKNGIDQLVFSSRTAAARFLGVSADRVGQSVAQGDRGMPIAKEWWAFDGEED